MMNSKKPPKKTQYEVGPPSSLTAAKHEQREKVSEDEDECAEKSSKMLQTPLSNYAVATKGWSQLLYSTEASPYQEFAPILDVAYSSAIRTVRHVYGRNKIYRPHG